MDEKFLRSAYVYEDEFWTFYNAQTKTVQDKIDWIIGLVRTVKIIPEKFFKHLEGTDGLFEGSKSIWKAMLQGDYTNENLTPYAIDSMFVLNLKYDDHSVRHKYKAPCADSIHE